MLIAKRFVFSILACSFFLSLTAQGNQESSFKPRITLRTNPTSILEVDGNFGIGIGYQWAEQWAVTIDPAYIFLNTYQGENEQRDRFSGIKLRADVRFYFEKSRKGKFNVFIAPEFHYKRRNARRWSDFGINCLNGQCDYFQTARYTEKKKEIGFALKLGTILPLSTALYLEIYAGAGLKEKRFSETDIPTGGSFVSEPRNNFFTIDSDTGDRFKPMLPAGLKVVLEL